MKQDPFQPDLRDCASREPKSELGNSAFAMFSKSKRAGNVLSEIGSQGFRK
jgi:hypothetical protein